MPRLDEFSLIDRYFAPLAADYPGALNLKDDAALIDVPPGLRLVATMDAMVAGVHFLADDPPDLIARKLVRVNLSDLAAMGAKPSALMLAAAFPEATDEAWLAAFAAGLAADVREYSIALIGGDTVATPGPLTLTLTALGHVEPGADLRRSGAKAGDAVCVSGTIGDAALGLKVLQGGLAGVSPAQADWLAGRYRLPQPRIALGRHLAGKATAAMDVSDGLCADLGHICEASGVAAVIEWDRVPLSEAARAALAGEPGLADAVLGGGDDYELLFTAPALTVERMQAAAMDTPIAVIGRIEAGQGVTVVDGSGNRISPTQTGWRHFGSRP